MILNKLSRTLTAKLKITISKFNFVITNDFNSEINYIRNILANSKDYCNTLSISLLPKDDIEIIKEDLIIEKDWESMNDKEILKNFENLSYYAFRNNMCIIDSKNERIVNVLSSRCSNFSDKEICRLLSYLELWNDKNLRKISTPLWNNLDNQCVERMKNWNINELLYVNDLIHKLKLLNYSHFSTLSLSKMYKKVRYLRHHQLVQLLFLISIKQISLINMYLMEYYLQKFDNELSIIEIVIFFRATESYNYSIQDPKFLVNIIEKLCDNIDSINDTFLKIILRNIRFVPRELWNSILVLLNGLETRISNVNAEVLIEIVNLQTKSLVYKKELTIKILERLKTDYKNLKFTMMFKLIHSLVILNHNKGNTDIYSLIIDELLDRNIKRKQLLIILCSMLQINYCHEKAIEVVMNSYNKFKEQKLINYYLFINYSLKIDYPKYSNPEVEAMKLSSDPIKKFRRNKNAQQLHEMLIVTCKQVLGSKSAVYVDSILPHISCKYIVICYDKKNNEFFSPGEKLSQIPDYEIKYAPIDDKNWYILIANSNTHLIQNTGDITGSLALQIRQLNSIGYTPISIFYENWINLSKDKKQSFILNIFNR